MTQRVGDQRGAAPAGSAPLQRLLMAVRKSGKYRHVSEQVVAHIGARELAARDDWREAVKATKNKLHQVGGAYFDGEAHYGEWLRQLRAAWAAGDSATFRSACAAVMQHHSSTRERLGILEQFYAVALAGLPPLRTVVDLACGLNPLAMPWMPLAQDAQYFAYDMYTDLADFLNGFMGVIGVAGQAVACDLVHEPPARSADLALVLKSLPCLEQLDRSASARLLDAIRADHVLISFPVHSLSGRHKGMVENYEARFWDLLNSRPWSVKRFAFATELAFLVTR